MSKKSFSVIIRAIVKKCLKTSALGRWMYPFFQKCWRAVVIPMRQKRLQKHGFDCLNRIHKVLTNNNIRYYCDYGTLLGFARDNGFILHDDDIDLSIPVSESKSPVEILKILLNSGYRYLHGFVYQDMLLEFTVIDRTGISIDIFITHAASKHGNRYYDEIYWKSTSQYPTENANNVIRRTFLDAEALIPFEIQGITVMVPSNAESMLASMYGDSWKTPIKNFTREEPEEAILPGFAFRLSEAEFISGKYC